MTSNHPDQLLTARQAASMLGYAEGTVRNKAAAGEIPKVKLGRALRFRRSEIEAWIDEQEASAAAPARRSA
jgi:excisionase family DNA binding protein